MSALDEPLTEDMLRDIRDEMTKGNKLTQSLTRAVLSAPPPQVVNHVPPAPTSAAPVVKVTVVHAKGWNFQVHRDADGKIESLTATPTT